MNTTYPDAQSLWNLPPHVFNEWRAMNDIPRLFSLFKELLPSFDEWLAALPFSMHDTVRIVPTGAIFKGTRKKVVIRRQGDVPGTQVVECHEGTADEAKDWWNVRSTSIEVLGEFEPYFHWAKRTLGKKRFFCYDKANRQMTDSFIYGGWSGLHPDTKTVAYLFRDHAVLKLGQVDLAHGIIIGSRNLDFTDLDYITVPDGFRGSNWKTISYSSCREIKFQNIRSTIEAFYTFHHCAMDKFYCENSKIQDFYFENILGFELTLSLKDSFIHKMQLNETSVLPLIEKCELREVTFLPKKSDTPGRIATTYRLWRSTYQSSGMRREASECYYNERVSERKSYFRPYRDNRKFFPSFTYGGELSSVIELYNRGFIKREGIYREIWKACKEKAKIWLTPRYNLLSLKFKIRWLTSLFEFAIWGYGERPSRIFATALIIITGYAAIYGHAIGFSESGNPKILDWIDSIYFSIVTFTTLGYGDIIPGTTFLKLLCASEAILGAFTIGLVVAGFSNRSRY